MTIFAFLVEVTITVIGTVPVRLQKGAGPAPIAPWPGTGRRPGEAPASRRPTAATSIRPSPFTAPPVVTVVISAHPVTVTVR